MGLEHGCIDEHLVAGADQNHIVDHDLIRGDLGLNPVTSHKCLRLPDQGQLGEGLCRAILLNDADGRVDHDDNSEQGIDQRGRGEHQNPQPTDEGVEVRQSVGTNDAAKTARISIVDDIDAPVCDPFGNLARGQTHHGIYGGQYVLRGHE